MRFSLKSAYRKKTFHPFIKKSDTVLLLDSTINYCTKIHRRKFNESIVLSDEIIKVQKSLSAAAYTPVSYTHLDVYKRQDK